MQMKNYHHAQYILYGFLKIIKIMFINQQETDMVNKLIQLNRNII